MLIHVEAHVLRGITSSIVCIGSIYDDFHVPDMGWFKVLYKL
jgi:hypothetical protein